MGRKVQVKTWRRTGYVRESDLSRWLREENKQKIIRLANLNELIVVLDGEWSSVKNTSWCWVVV